MDQTYNCICKLKSLKGKRSPKDQIILPDAQGHTKKFDLLANEETDCIDPVIAKIRCVPNFIICDVCLFWVHFSHRLAISGTYYINIGYGVRAISYNTKMPNVNE